MKAELRHSQENGNGWLVASGLVLVHSATFLLRTTKRWVKQNILNYIIVFTWSPRLSPASAALLPISTVSTKIPNPLSLPPRRLKNKGESLEGFCRVICLHFALAAQAIFSNLRWPFIFCNTEDTKCSAMFLLSEMEKWLWKIPQVPENRFLMPCFQILLNKPCPLLQKCKNS